MKNTKLEAIAKQASEDLAGFVGEAEAEILEAWDAAVKEAELQETKPKLKLAFGITLDLNKNNMETSLSFGVRHTLSRTAEIPDPDQRKLELEDPPRVKAAETTVELRTASGTTGPIPMDRFKRAVEAVKARRQQAQ